MFTLDVYGTPFSAIVILTESMMRQNSLQSIETTVSDAIDSDDELSGMLWHMTTNRERSYSSSPETPRKRNGQEGSLESTLTDNEKDQCIQVQLPLKLERRLKIQRTESIRSDEDTQSVRSVSVNTDVEDDELSHERPSPKPPSQPFETVITTKLRPVPKGAPRTIERKGQYTIRKGVRIQDYRLPGPNPWPRASPSNSLEYQCRDGFNEKEASLGYPQPMVAWKRRAMCKEAVWEHDRPHLQISPSLGALNPV
ncbi:unnamed protein product [Fusarium graminearum]|uniref:Uncharacterized protein n=1 Tax=Gibberella zeae TaxID=5518 RepID=A0A4E9EAC9_GIBZA|nr:hypothetical protein FG05_06218 [Fusarium graminearum]CAF3491340.1 unnamed protein product [Fusarium graminearum]CAG1971569.1 unnamed protein product [Fusarium graminearum]